MVIGEVKTTGLEHMGALPALLQAAIKEGLEASADLLKEKIDQTIANSPATGIIYKSKKGDGSDHRAAAPGQPMAQDTGGTQSDIEIDKTLLPAGEIKVGWTDKRALQAAAQEFGSLDGRIPAHPTMIPAALEAMPEIREIIEKAINTVV